MVYAMENEHNKLYPEDQERVNQYLNAGYNDVERKPFRPLKLLFILLIVVSFFTGLSLMLAHLSGVY
jgi:CheY-like chemotaxis protein